jgi:uncharacterized protein with beta-barrel porin domain
MTVTSKFGLPCVLRERGRLRQHRAAEDFLVLPAAVGLGVLLVTPAAGQTVIGADVSGTVNLADASAYPGGGPFTVSQGVTVSAAGPGRFAVFGALAASLTNDGVILANPAGASGVGLVLGGTVTNDGQISAASDGIHTTNAAAAIGNTGSIVAGYDGISLDAGGAVTNNAGAVISGGHIGVYTGSADSSVSNSGTILGGEGDGVSLYVGGNFSNGSAGVVHGGYAGVYIGGSGFTLQNSGTIGGADYGVLLHGNTLANKAGGVISGGLVGVYAGGGAMVSNAGDISGATGLEFNGTGATVVNTGTIASTVSGGDAVVFDAAGVNTLVLAGGSVIDGAIDGGGGAGEIDLTGTGQLGNNITDFGAGSMLSVTGNWTATGSWNIGDVTNDGVLQAGVIGTPLTLDGDFVQSATGILRVVLTPSESTQFAISGTARLAGTLDYVFAPGYYAPYVYNFLTASGGVTGTFSAVTYTTGVPAGLEYETSYGANGSSLVLLDGYLAPSDDGLFSAANQAMAVAAQQTNVTVLDHAAAPDGRGCAAARLGGNGTALRLADAFCAAGGWAEADGGVLNADGAASYDAETGGFLAGIDRPVDDEGTRVGFAVGYDETWLRDGAGGKGTAGTTRVGIYAAQPVGRFTIAADFMYGHADNTTRRATGVGTANAHYGSETFSGGVQGSVVLNVGQLTLMPAAGVKIASVNSDGFTETGGGLPGFALTGAASHYSSVQPFFNLGINRNFVTGSGIVITPDASVGYQVEAGDRGKAVNVTAADSTVFATSNNRLAASAAVLTAGIEAAAKNIAVCAHYTAYLSGNWTAQTADAGVEVRF